MASGSVHDLNETERYAAAALFTLALHNTLVEVGVDQLGSALADGTVVWGCPTDEMFDDILFSGEHIPLDQDQLAGFWGWDCVGPAGLCRRLYAALQIPHKAWPGLLRMPDVPGAPGSPAGVEEFVQLVRRYSAFLDPDLQFTSGSARRVRRPEAADATDVVNKGQQGQGQQEQGQQAQQQQQQQQQEEEEEMQSLGVGEASRQPEQQQQQQQVRQQQQSQQRQRDGDAAATSISGKAAALDRLRPLKAVAAAAAAAGSPTSPARPYTPRAAAAAAGAALNGSPATTPRSMPYTPRAFAAMAAAAAAAAAGLAGSQPGTPRSLATFHKRSETDPALLLAATSFLDGASTPNSLQSAKSTPAAGLSRANSGPLSGGGAFSPEQGTAGQGAGSGLEGTAGALELGDAAAAAAATPGPSGAAATAAAGGVPAAAAAAVGAAGLSREDSASRSTALSEASTSADGLSRADTDPLGALLSEPSATGISREGSGWLPAFMAAERPTVAAAAGAAGPSGSTSRDTTVNLATANSEAVETQGLSSSLQQQALEQGQQQQQQQQEQQQGAPASQPSAALSDASEQRPASSSTHLTVDYEGLRQQVDILPREAKEGAVMPEATFSPSVSYSHATSHKAVAALYELIGGCLTSSTDQLMASEIAEANRAVQARKAQDEAARRQQRRQEQQRQQKMWQEEEGGEDERQQQQQQQQRQLQQGDANAGDVGGSRQQGSQAQAGQRPQAAVFFPGPDDSPTQKLPSNQGTAATQLHAATSSDDGGATASSSPGAATSPGAAVSPGASSSPGAAISPAAPNLSPLRRQSSPMLTQLQQDALQQRLIERQRLEKQQQLQQDKLQRLLVQKHQQGKAQFASPGSSPRKQQQGQQGQQGQSTGGSSSGSGGSSGISGRDAPPEGIAALRLYDARARVALKRVAHWLRVPWPQMRAFEQMWALQALGELDAGTKPVFQSSSRALQYLRVGAAAVGGGALLALTGGLAAPAIAAGLGAAITLVHGSAAAAAAVTGFASTTAGTAAVTSAFGAWGASAGGSSTANLFADVKEFGFWDLSQSIWASGGPPVQAKEPATTTGTASTAGAGTAAAGTAAAGIVAAVSSGGSQSPSPAPQLAAGAADSEQPSSRLLDGFTSSSQEPGPAAKRPAASAGATSSSSTGQTAATAATAAATASPRGSTDSAPQPAAAPAGVNPPTSSGSSANGSSSLTSWLWRRSTAEQKPAPPVLRPLLPIPVNPKRADHGRLALTLGVTGMISGPDDFVKPWELLSGQDCERFGLVWESNILKELGAVLGKFLRNQAIQQGAQHALQTFFYTGLVGALSIPMAINTAINVTIGSKWLVALRRAQSAGRMLAVLLLQGCHGDRPVTLVGFSMGARLIFHCLQELAKAPGGAGKGIVESAVLLGTPVSIREERWAAARSVVSGRFINGYSVNDWTLGVVYRAHSSSSIWHQAAGIWQVGVPGVENVNLSKIVNGHTDYLECMGDILEIINLRGD